MSNFGNKAWAVVYIGLVGAIFMGILTHANQFKTVFGSVTSFILSEMGSLKG